MSQCHNIDVGFMRLISVKGTIATKRLTGISVKGCLLSLIYSKFPQKTKPLPIDPLHFWLSRSRGYGKVTFLLVLRS